MHQAIVLLIGLVAFVILALLSRPDRSKGRRVRLESKYAASPRRELIMAGKVSHGMSEEEVCDAWGKPAGRSHRALKTKTVDVLRYGSGRSSSRVTLENGRVVGWTSRG